MLEWETWDSKESSLFRVHSSVIHHSERMSTFNQIVISILKCLNMFMFLSFLE